MKHLRFLALIILVLACFSSCKKDDPNAIYDANFYTSTPNYKLFLYIDENYCGQLPYFATPPTCESYNTDGLHPLAMQLKSGSHKIESKDSTGFLMSTGYASFSSSRESLSGNLGGMSSFSVGKCIVIGVFL